MGGAQCSGVRHNDSTTRVRARRGILRPAGEIHRGAWHHRADHGGGRATQRGVRGYSPHDLPRCWAFCVGQAVKIELGLLRRAPSGWQSVGLEWLWRLLQEPSRLTKRYVTATIGFAAAVIEPGTQHARRPNKRALRTLAPIRLTDPRQTRQACRSPRQHPDRTCPNSIFRGSRCWF